MGRLEGQLRGMCNENGWAALTRVFGLPKRRHTQSGAISYFSLLMFIKKKKKEVGS
jgi:hypothetical protein